MPPPVEKMNAALKQLLAVEKNYSAMPIVGALCAAYVLYVATRFPESADLDGILKASDASPDLVAFIQTKLKDHWEAYKPMLTSLREEELAEIFDKASCWLHYDRYLCGCTALPLVDLAVKVLGLKPGDSVCDLGSGTGDFLRKAYSAVNDFNRKPEVVGYELDGNVATISEMLSRVNACDAKIVQGDMFNPNCLETGKTFDKVYCCPPFGMQVFSLQKDAMKFLAKEFPAFPLFSPYSPGDWIFAARAYAATKKGGKAVVILPAPAMYGGRADDFRRYFLRKKLVEAVVELPDQLLDSTKITTYLVILSENNDKVKMINASTLCERLHFRNVLGKDHVEKIASMLEGAGSTEGMAVVVDRDQLMKDDCNLTVRRHFAEPVSIKDGVSFAEFVLATKRGAPIASRDLDSNQADVDTGVYYMAPSNINDGIIDEKLPRLKDIPKESLGFGAKNGDIVVSRIASRGAAFKVAVVEVEEGKVVIPNGNLFVIIVDKKKADPYFLKSYLESEYAQKYIQNVSVGNTAMNLQYRDLAHLPVPNYPIQRQHEIGEKCRAAIHAVVQARKRLQNAKEALSTLFFEYAPDRISKKGRDV